MARTSASDGKWWRMAVLLCAQLLLASSVNCQWTLQTFAQDFCNAIATTAGSSCDCVDTQIISGDGEDFCGAGEALGNGFTVDSSTFTGWSGGDPTPDTQILLQDECDARSSTTNTVQCAETGSQSMSSSTTTSYTEGLNIQITLGFSLPGLVTDTTQFSFSFSHSSSTETGNTVTASDTCGPPSSGQPEGTCAVYTESYNSYNMPNGRGFTYDAVVSGGVQMSFGDPVDAQGAIGQGGDGSKHYFWYFPIDEMVTYGQSSLGQLNNMNQFDPPSAGCPVTYHGSGTLAGSFLDVSTECTTCDCN